MRNFHAILLMLLMLPGIAHANQSMDSVSQSYIHRIESATKALNDTRNRILEEKAPLSKRIGELNDQNIELNAEILRLKSFQSKVQIRKAQLQEEIKATRENLNYSSLLAEEALATMQSILLPGESMIYGQEINLYLARLSSHESVEKPQYARKAFDLILQRMQRQIGGYSRAGQSLLQDDNRVFEGEYYFVGPVSYFFETTGETGGLAMNREQSFLPVTYPLKDTGKTQFAQLKAGETTVMPVDVTGGKALHLKEARGTPLEHIQKGGVVGYSILFLGAFALLASLLKLIDFRDLNVDSPKAIASVLKKIGNGPLDPEKGPWMQLRKCTRDLFAIGAKHAEKPRELVEELMFAYILLQRNHHEKRLPLLKVIAAAAPLLGLLGTVVGMMKTFTLITVFGTGNASKLSSGISEALVTTQLGLMVAIPTLVIYGYLAHNTERKLLLLEQYATDFLNTVATRKPTEQPRNS